MKRFKQPVQIMKAPDMFQPEVCQTFDKKTGQRISYGHLEIDFEEDPEEIVVPDPEQLALF